MKYLIFLLSFQISAMDLRPNGYVPNMSKMNMFQKMRYMAWLEHERNKGKREERIQKLIREGKFKEVKKS